MATTEHLPDKNPRGPYPELSPQPGPSGHNPPARIPNPDPKPPRRKRLPWLLSLTFLVMALTFAEVIVWEDGAPKLRPKRVEKLEKEIREIEDAEQYVLTANREAWYPCINCPSGKIYLFPENVWKYGVTRRGMRGRYRSDYTYKNNLNYLVEFRGDIKECLIQEKIKIYNYPLLPENLVRPDSLRLAYPPGNVQDN